MEDVVILLHRSAGFAKNVLRKFGGPVCVIFSAVVQSKTVKAVLALGFVKEEAKQCVRFLDA
jgi:hypothetical protein